MSVADEVHVWKIIRDDDGRVVTYRLVDANPSALAKWGMTRGEVEGKTADEILGPGTVDRQMPLIEQVIMQGVPRVYEEYSPDLDRYFRLTSVPFGDGFVTTGVDVTERRRAEETLKYQEFLLRQMGRIAHVGGWEFNPETGEGTWTDEVARIHGLDPSDETSMERGMSFYHGESKERIDKAVSAAIEKGEPYDLELELTTIDGVHKWVHTIGVPTIEDGRVVRVAGSFQDITEQKRVEGELAALNRELEERVEERTQALESANKELEAFSYSVSHDLRAPLRHITGYIELLQSRYDDKLDERGRRYLDTVSESAVQMGRLIGDILELSRTGRQEMHVSIVDMETVLQEALQQLADVTAAREIEWQIDRLPKVRGDRALLRLVWLNLVDNAVKYSRGRTPAHISISADRDDGEMVFTVRDDGAGFDMHYVGKLFGVFQRLHPTGEFEGTGIGLANVRRIVSRHGGRTWAEGEVDKGAAFHFSLPFEGTDDQ